MPRYTIDKLNTLISNLEKLTSKKYKLDYYSGRYSLIIIHTKFKWENVTEYHKPNVLYHILFTLVRYSQIVTNWSIKIN